MGANWTFSPREEEGWGEEIDTCICCIHPCAPYVCVCVERICTKIKLSRRERRKGKRERGNVHLISSEWALWTATAQEAQEHSETLYIYIYIYWSGLVQVDAANVPIT